MQSMMSSTSKGLWRFEGTWRCIGWCCWGVGGRATDDALVGSSIWGDSAVHQEVLSGGEAAVQDTVEAVGREGGATDHAGVVGRSV